MSKVTFSAGQIPDRDFDHAAFLSGVPICYGPEWRNRSFSYKDDAWHPLELAKINDRLSQIAFRFHNLPEWLKEDAKRYAASAWLEQSKSAAYISTTLSIVGKHLGRTLPGFQGTSTMDLTAHHATQVQRHLVRLVEQSKMSHTTAVQTVSRINTVVRFIRQLPANAGRHSTFRLKAAREWRKRVNRRVLGQSVEKVIPVEVAQALLLACEREVEVYEELQLYESSLRKPDGKLISLDTRRRRGIKRPHRLSMSEARNRAIKAQTIVLSLLSGRRAGSITTLPLDPKIEEVVVRDAPMLKVWFHEHKITDYEEPVVIPIEAREIALESIRRVQKYGRVYRVENPATADYLFVIGGKKGGSRVLNGVLLNEYLNGGPQLVGVLERYGIERDGDIAYITMHNFRTTRLTWIGERAGVHVARQDAGHRNVLMTSQFYIAGTPKMQKLAEEALSAGAVPGEVYEIIAGRAEAERVTPRLIRMLMRGEEPKVVNITRYGLCFLQAETGPCPTGNPCWLGIRPDSDPIRRGQGCEWQGLTADALPALQHDERMLLQQLELYTSDPRFAYFVPNLFERLRIVQQQIEEAQRLQEQRNQWRAGRAEEKT